MLLKQNPVKIYNDDAVLFNCTIKTTCIGKNLFGGKLSLEVSASQEKLLDSNNGTYEIYVNGYSIPGYKKVLLYAQPTSLSTNMEQDNLKYYFMTSRAPDKVLHFFDKIVRRLKNEYSNRLRDEYANQFSIARIVYTDRTFKNTVCLNYQHKLTWIKLLPHPDGVTKLERKR